MEGVRGSFVCIVVNTKIFLIFENLIPGLMCLCDLRWLSIWLSSTPYLTCGPLEMLS